MDLINLIEEPGNPGKPATTHMGKNIFHVTVTFSEASAAPVLGFTTDHTAPSWLWHFYTTEMYDRVTWLCGVSEILSVPKPVLLALVYFHFTVSMKKGRMYPNKNLCIVVRCKIFAESWGTVSVDREGTRNVLWHDLGSAGKQRSVGPSAWSWVAPRWPWLWKKAVHLSNNTVQSY